MRKTMIRKIFFIFPVVLFFLCLNIPLTKAEIECENSINQGRCEIEVDITSDTDNCLPITLYTISPNPLGCASNEVCCLPKTVTDCAGKPDGTTCGYGYCYDGKCLMGDGEFGQPCGNNPGSICIETIFCNNQDTLGGRNCASGLICCEKDAAKNQACTDIGGKCLPDPTSEYPNKSNDQEANNSCYDFQAGNPNECYLPSANLPSNPCTESGGTCIHADMTCEYPLSYPCSDNSQICCGNKPDTPSGEEGGVMCPEYGEGLAGGFLFFKGSLVPCGRHCDDPGTDLDETKTCTICHLIILFKRVYDLLLSMLFIVSLVMLTVGGVVYIISTGNPGLTSMAKGLITKTLTGFGLFLVSWLLVFTILKFISANTDFLGDSPTNWFEFTCDIESKFDTGTTAPTTTAPTTVPTVNGYTYSPADITNPTQQKADASSELNSLLACMEPQLPDAAKIISSVSDSAGMENCIISNWTDPICAHSKGSCHYGGTKCPGKSYAVDFKGITYENELKAAAKNCNTNGTVKFLEEGNHIHISINGIACGCDIGLSAP